MKGKRIHREIRKRAEALYTEEGLSPEEIVETLSDELRDYQLNIPGKDPDEIELPQNRSTIIRWAKVYNWTPHWTEARGRRQDAIQAGEPFGTSGINDPIFYLSRIKALKRVDELISQYPEADNQQIAQAVLMHVNLELSPGPRVIREINPIIKKAIEQARQSPRPTEEERLQAIMCVKLAPGETYVHHVPSSPIAVGAIPGGTLKGKRGPARRSK
jgi:hypothetical protein